jgi:hypothetical protein
MKNAIKNMEIKMFGKCLLIFFNIYLPLVDIIKGQVVFYKYLVFLPSLRVITSF